jgi:hypothetical protein
MGLITKGKSWVDNDNVLYTDLNGNFDTLYTLVNGDIDDDNIAVGADIDPAKIAGTAVTLTGTETLTNKTLTSPTINTPTIATPTVTSGTFTKPTINGSIQAYTSDTDGTTVTFNLAASNVHTVTLGGNRTLALSNASTGQCFIIRLVQDATGSRTVTWFSTIKWQDGTTPTLTTTASKTDVFGFICTGSGTYDGFIVGQNL